ncbi:unnamed protein product [Brassica oleracea var. botrytis]|uniref:(rape) hypothetical protein n=1 Tax=Brassica napus TaxID=3708 RepID=A0A816JT50_BRANA|nr:unnamed protein product [Brassica napus]
MSKLIRVDKPNHLNEAYLLTFCIVWFNYEGGSGEE